MLSIKLPVENLIIPWNEWSIEDVFFVFSSTFRFSLSEFEGCHFGILEHFSQLWPKLMWVRSLY